MREPSVFERVVAEAIDPDWERGEIARMYAKRVVRALATSDEVREALVDTLDRAWADRVAAVFLTDAILAALRPEAQG